MTKSNGENKIKLEHNEGQHEYWYCPVCVKSALNLGRLIERSVLLSFINQQRDEGNMHPQLHDYTGAKAFNPALCLSELIKRLEGK